MDGVDVNSREASLWSETMRLKSELEHARTELAAERERYECPIGISNPMLCSAGTCVECRVERARAAERERCQAEIERLSAEVRGGAKYNTALCVHSERLRAMLANSEACLAAVLAGNERLIAAEREQCAEIVRLEGARASQTDDSCAVPLERQALRIEAAIRKGGRLIWRMLSSLRTTG